MSDRLLADWRQHALTLESEVNKVVVGQTKPVRLITTAIFARGHVLLEGDVGVGKTTLLRAFTRGNQAYRGLLTNDYLVDFGF